MKRYHFYLVLLAVCAATAWITKAHDPIDKTKWVKYVLDRKWAFTAPAGAKINSFGEASDVEAKGIVTLKDDLVKLEFDSEYIKPANNTTCSLKATVARLKKRIDRGDYRHFDTGEVRHVVRADSIHGMGALIVTPVKTGIGITYIAITDCENAAGLSMLGKNLSASNQAIVLEIFKGIHHVPLK
ncbi:hypothetical protein [Hymenobacter armeniacus]|uniref:YceI family protein n=1 Tax=Hymenobacter armeniacus TaxID=2771358 RepID=A0ABR8JRK3_9BACT|nr:hypothetical protein [Hymenobacter armeniacus]MBD2721947.1 hypothetical protein [Hymenobacter armeniacus]